MFVNNILIIFNKKFMQILKIVKRMVVVILSAVTCLTLGLFVSTDGGDKVITIQMGLYKY